MEDKLLIKIAMEAREKSYSPYSNYKVGAAVYTRSGKVFTGCNIESASFSPTICAERVAVSKCISEGYKDIEKIASERYEKYQEKEKKDWALLYGDILKLINDDRSGDSMRVFINSFLDEVFRYKWKEKGGDK